MSALRHPNIALFLGACTKPPRQCIVLEYCENGSLWNLLHFSSNELQWKARKRFALDIARALNYLHSLKPPIIHRDVKSLNVLVDSKYTCKLSDFGWARSKEVDMTGKIGTYQWMAPEVISCNSYTEKADVYSFGIIMWEIITRKPPYFGMDAKDVATMVVLEGIRPPIKECDHPQAWVSLMKKCWAKDPTKRPSFPSIILEIEQIKDQ